MRKLVAALLAAVLIAVVAIWVTATFAVQRRAAAAVETLKRQVSESTHLVLEVGDVHVSWLPPAVVADSRIRTRKQYGSLPVMENARVVVVPDTASLLFGRPGIRSLEIHDARFVTRLAEDQSALPLLGVVRGSPIPVRLSGCRIDIDRGAGIPVIDVHHVDLTFTPHDAVVDVAGTLSPLGERSHGSLQGTWRPGAGRTGGDGLKIQLDVQHGEPAALVKIVPLLENASLTDEVKLQLTADGFLGERSTETAPAEPLSGHLRAEAGINLLGLERPAVFESGVSLDDRRWVLHEGQGRWGERPFTFAGWIERAASANKIGLRMSFKDVNVADVLADYGIAERWRPKAQASGEIRMTESFDYPLTHYEAKAPSVQFDAWPSLPMSSGPMKVRGSLAAVNAEVSGSFDTDELHVGPVTLFKPLVGVRWWRDKLTVTSLNLPMWGGKFDGSFAYEPKGGEEAKGGFLLANCDAAKFMAQTMPGSALQLAGHMDLSVATGVRDKRLWVLGRVGVHGGTLGPKSVLRAILSEVVTGVGAKSEILDELAARHPVLSPDALKFERLAADFKTIDERIGVRIADLLTEGGSLLLDGTVDTSERLATTGVATFAPVLTADLVERVPVLAKLTGKDGGLIVPVHVDGSPNDFHVTIDEPFAAALAKAREGKSPERVAVVPPEPSFEIPPSDLPPLEEQFGR